jgi:HTH-type transcriptional regulator/antitoxin HigA
MGISHELHSDLAVPPGEYLEEVLEELGWTKKELSQRLDRPAPKLSQIFNGKKAITPQTALQLEDVVGVPAHIWLGLEDEYRLVLARNAERAQLEQEQKLITRFCYAELLKRGVLEKVTRAIDKVKALRRFFNVSSLMLVSSIDRYAPAFRLGAPGGKRSAEATAAWLQLGVLQAEGVDTPPYNKRKLERLIPKLPPLSRQTPDSFLPQLKELLAEVGVVLVIVPHLPKTYVQGATFALSSAKRIVMLSLRYRWADILWFSLLHELGHLVLHQPRETYLDFEQEDSHSAELEHEADRFAGDTLIPPEEYSSFTEQTEYYSATEIRAFADMINVHPGIVVGRLQHDKLLSHQWRNELRSKIKGASIEHSA